VRTKEQDYDSEDLLQALLAQYPNLMAADQIDSAVPRRCLLIKLEKEVSGKRRKPDDGRSIICSWIRTGRNRRDLGYGPAVQASADVMEER
jgi:hypothetical protein